MQCDKVFKAIMDKVKHEMGIESNTSNEQDHAPAAECNDRMLKEAFRMALHHMPCKMTFSFFSFNLSGTVMSSFTALLGVLLTIFLLSG